MAKKAEEFKTIPITLVTGYLGSGKTTLINHILTNSENYKMAVIVNDIGEVNIDADLIEKGGVVSSKDDNLIPLQNGCICCTLKGDLIKQLADLVNTGKFDHILIEASGICEPIPIAQSITYMQDTFKQKKLPEFYKLDSVISVTDALRLRDEFGCGDTIRNAERGEEDIENLIIQQLEFCNIVLLNKVSEISGEELGKIKAMIKALQPDAEIICTDYCDVSISKLVDTNLFSYEKAIVSSGWMQEFDDRDNEKNADEHDEHDEHDGDHDGRGEHGHHHHHHEHGMDENDDESGEEEEYGIGTYVYYRRRPFNKIKFTDWTKKDYGRMITRTKGMCYFIDEMDSVYLYEQAGRQKTLSECGVWYSASVSPRKLKKMLETDENLKSTWDETYGDRMIKLVFIGQKIDKEKIKEDLDKV